MTDHAFPDALPALSRLHWYVLERVLGQGGFGITYLARDTNLDQRVAIKEYLPVDVATRLQDATVRSRTDDLRDRYRLGLERFVQEARTLARFDHPNIVRVHSVFEFNNTAYMVMRFEEGGTLSALLDRRGTLPETDLLRIVLPVLDGLELVHNAGFIHRDIKPDNIHIGDDGTPVLLDFGSARQALGSSNMLTILIAPGYAPFEQYYSDATGQGPWTDIYGLGATCYRAISGRAPLDAVSRSKGVLGSTQDVMVPASVIGVGRYSGRLLAAIDHALAFAEKDRPQTIAEWRRELAGDATAPALTHAGALPSFPRSRTTVAQTQAPAGTAASLPLTSERAPLPVRSASPLSRKAESPSRSSTRAVVIIAVLSAAIVAVGIAAYVVMAGRSNDETRTRIAALEKQIRDRGLADADRERAQAEEQARQRKAQEQAGADEEKNRADLTRKREAEARATPNEAKRPQEAVAKQQPPTRAQPSPTRAQPTLSPPVPAAPASTDQALALPASLAGVAQPAPASPELQKPPPPTPADQLADADRATAAQRYADAIAILRPLADAGNVQAQTRLGDAYAEGRGMPRDAFAAAGWYEKAAFQGDISAQLKLGGMYANGSGINRNNNFAYVWYATAARLGSSEAKSERDRIAPLLQPAEREQADRLIERNVARMAKKS